MKDTLLFIDPCCPRPYDPSNIDTPGGVGGTEMTMVTLADGLSEHFNVVVEQHNRQDGDDYYEGKTHYTSPNKAACAEWVVVLRNSLALGNARERFPNAKLYLYSHDLAGPQIGNEYRTGVFKDSRCSTNICVSDWHRNQSIQVLNSFGYTGEFRTRYIYNPLSEDVKYEQVNYDRNKLMWLASPHKGLNRAYEIFEQLVRINPEFKFYVTNPGYLDNPIAVHTNTKILGTLPHAEVIRELRTALCLFYPNTVFPETFGKIMAEANTIGVPVLTHPIGASREVLDSHPAQLVDCRDTEKVVKTVMLWYNGCRPHVRGRPEFKLNRVVKEWIKLLNDLR